MPEAYAKPCQISEMIRHTENPDIVRKVHSIQFTVFKQFQAYLGTFNNIQPCSGIVRDIKACCGTFRHYWEKNSKMFPCEAFFSCIFDGMLFWNVLDPRNPPMVWNFLVVRLRSVLILLVKHSILNVWQCSECFCLDNCSVIYTVTPYYVLHQTDSEFWRIQNSFCSDMYSYNPERNIFRHIYAIKTYSHKGHYI